MSPIVDCAARAWNPAMGDPGIAGWAAATGYLAAALAALWRGLRADPRRGRRETAVWLCVGLALACLAFNKQLDLQTMLRDALSCVARVQGWYGDRRLVQAAFFGVAATTAGLGAVVLLPTLRLRHIVPIVPIVGGMGLIVAYVLLRMAAATHIGAPPAPGVLVTVEGLGILLVLIGALCAFPARRRHPKDMPERYAR